MRVYKSRAKPKKPINYYQLCYLEGREHNYNKNDFMDFVMAAQSSDAYIRIKNEQKPKHKLYLEHINFRFNYSLKRKFIDVVFNVRYLRAKGNPKEQILVYLEPKEYSDLITIQLDLPKNEIIDILCGENDKMQLIYNYIKSEQCFHDMMKFVNDVEGYSHIMLKEPFRLVPIFEEENP